MVEQRIRSVEQNRKPRIKSEPLAFYDSGERPQRISSCDIKQDVRVYSKAIMLSSSEAGFIPSRGMEQFCTCFPGGIKLEFGGDIHAGDLTNSRGDI